MVAGVLGVLTAAGALLAASPATASPAIATASPTPTTTAPTPHPIGEALAFALPKGTVLTLPAADGLRDSTVVAVVSGRPGLVDVVAVRGRTTVKLATHAALRSTSTGWTRRVTVKVAGLTAGTWRLRAQRSSAPSVRTTSGTFAVGSGAAVHVAVRPAVRTLYPFKDGTLDSAAVTIVATDETGAQVPAHGSVRIDAGRRHITRTLSTAGTATLPVTSLPLGHAIVKATVTGASGAKAVRTTGLTLAPTGVGTSRIARSSDTVQPVVDGLLDSVVLTTTGAASAGSTAKVSGTLTVSRTVAKVTTVAAAFPVPDGGKHAFTWDGRVRGVVVPGTYTVTLALKGPQGLARTTTRTLLVTKAHLPYAVRDMFTVAAGNQQGLAVRNGFFYVGYDIGNGQSRIDTYSSAGALVGSLGPLSIQHVAELAYSTTTDKLYAATGGASTPTQIFVLDPTSAQWSMAQPSDPMSVVQQTYDFSAQLGDNAMVSVDDVNKRLLVFSGATGNYSVSAVTLTDTPVLNADGTPAMEADGTTPRVTPAGSITSTVPVAITGVPQGMDLVGPQLWIYTSVGKLNRVAKYDLTSSGLYTAAASTSADLYWSGEGEGMATVQATDTNDGLPAWIYVGAHSANRIGELVPVTDQD